MKSAACLFAICMVFSAGALAATVAVDSTAGLDTGLAWPVVEKATRSADMNARAEAMHALTFVNGTQSTALLTDGLADAQWNVRKYAIMGLVKLGDAKAKVLLTECLYNPSLPLGKDGLALLADVPAVEARAMFLKAIMDPANPARQMLVDNLFIQEPDVAASYLSAGLTADPEYFTGKLKKIKTPILPGILTRLAADKNPAVAGIAVGMAIAEDVKIDAAVLNLMLKSKDNAIKYIAAEALALQGNVEAAKILLPFADGDNASKVKFLKAAAAAPSPAVQEKAFAMLAKETAPAMVELIYMCFPATTDMKVLSKLEADITGTVAEGRSAAVRAIGKVKGTRALPQLNELLTRDGNPDVRVAAAKAIGDLGQAESVRVLGEASNDRDIRVKMAVIEALGKINDRAVVTVANFLAFDPNAEVKLAAIKAIAKVNHPDALQVLRVATDEPNPCVRKLVLAAMIRLDKDQAMGRFDRMLLGLGHDPIIELAAEFKDDFGPFARAAGLSQYPWARQAAVASMKYMPTARITLLQELALTSNFVDTRVDAMAALGELEPKIGFDNASALVKDANPFVRAAAFKVVAKSADPLAAELLLRGIEDPDEYVKAVAAAGIFERASAAKPTKETKSQNKKSK